jgi:hypothetical protein
VYLHRPEFFFRSCRRSDSEETFHRSFISLQEPDSGSYPEADEFSPHPPALFLYDHFNTILPFTPGRPCGLFPTDHSARFLCVFLNSAMCVTCAVYLILLGSIIIAFSEEYKLRSSSLFSFLHHVASLLIASVISSASFHLMSRIYFLLLT